MLQSGVRGRAQKLKEGVISREKNSTNSNKRKKTWSPAGRKSVEMGSEVGHDT